MIPESTKPVLEAMKAEALAMLQEPADTMSPEERWKRLGYVTRTMTTVVRYEAPYSPDGVPPSPPQQGEE